MQHKSDLKIGITVGDIHGIGTEIIIKALSNKSMLELCTPVIYGSGKLISIYRKTFQTEHEFNYTQVKDAQLQANRVNVVNCWQDDVKVEPGIAQESGGKYALIALDQATTDLKAGKLDALVTGPVDKAALKSIGFEFPGHTEYFGNKLEGKPMMLMIHERLRVALFTGHIGLSEVSKHIKKEQIISTVEQLNQILLQDFGIRKPKTAILGLNPHAGDNGMFGNEEKLEILPAVEALRNKGVIVSGPYPADGFFASGDYKKFDAVLAMYHDQGLIPFKTIAGLEGVNYTAGLSHIRTSPDHGTAFDIAGKGIASEESVRCAVYAAIDIYRKRNEYRKISANPLRMLTAEELNEMK
jgi:4-hydroxythreonine-4-phosphate dehydrogenase